MIFKNLKLSSAAILLLTSLNALGISITQTEVAYISHTISAEGVKGVNVHFKHTYERKSCNRLRLSQNFIKTFGNGAGYYDRYFVSIGGGETEINCPLPAPVTDVIETPKKFFKSSSSAYRKGVVSITVLAPKGYELIATEVK